MDTLGVATSRRYFHVPARELLLDAPQRCPVLPGLALQGLAVAEGEQHHLSLGSGTRFYVGPDTATVQRRAGILAAGLRQAGLAADHAQLAGAWVQEAWEASLDELVAAIAAPRLGWWPA